MNSPGDSAIILKIGQILKARAAYLYLKVYYTGWLIMKSLYSLANRNLKLSTQKVLIIMADLALLLIIMLAAGFLLDGNIVFLKAQSAAFSLSVIFSAALLLSYILLRMYRGIAPVLDKLFSGGSVAPRTGEVNVEELLGRDVINISKNHSGVAGRVVMVTGAGGSIGSELCRQVTAQLPAALVMVDISENGLYEIQQELIRNYGCQISLHAEVASIRDKRKIDFLFERYRPEIVYHAAAHKHVPLMEFTPEEAVKNNITGTINVAQSADKYGAKRFVMLSTDKAVNPTSIMGATKRVCEMIIQSMNKVSETNFVAVRFGNVLGSSGSVIPLFKEQIAAGGPVTVTHPEIIRYFMTISEAVSLVMSAGEIASGGEIFVLDMGKPVKILDLAQSLIRLSGYEPYIAGSARKRGVKALSYLSRLDTDNSPQGGRAGVKSLRNRLKLGESKRMEIVFTGLRPGEKLYEELLMSEEGLIETRHRKIFIGRPIDVSPGKLFEFIKAIEKAAEENDSIAVVQKLREFVPGFHIIAEAV